jgi:Cdc6-like AAA superfamily ATPase
MDDNQKEKILNWLTPVDYGPQQSDHFSRQQEGTGQWLLVSHEFRKWLNERKQTLYCDGIPGAGKTIMTSIVVEHLNNRHRNDISTSIVYLYCDFRRQQKPFDLLTSLLKQLAWQHSHLPEDMKNLYNYHRKGQSRPSFCQISQLLQTFMAEYQRVFIIIDAIDECPVSNGDRVKFLSEIFRLQAETGANVFATSRVNNDIKKLFEGALSLEIRARVEDIQKYINAQTETLQPDIFDNSMRHKIGREIIEAADGMYAKPSIHNMIYV